MIFSFEHKVVRLFQADRIAPDPPPVETGVYDAKPAQAGCGRADSHPMFSALQRTSGC
jgi:hypothetical protein